MAAEPNRLGPGKFVRDVGVRTLFQSVNALKGLLLLPLIAKLFGPTGYGIWAQVMLTIPLLAPLLMLRLDSGLVRYLGGMSDREQRMQTFFGSAVLVWTISFIVVVLVLTARRAIAQIMFADPGLSSFSVLFALLLAARVNLTFVLCYYRAMSAIWLYTILQTVQVIGEVGVIYGLSLLGSGRLGDALVALVVVDSVLLIGMLGDIIRRDGFSVEIPWHTLGRILRYSAPLIAAGAMYWVVDSSDRYVIVHFLGLDQAGVYSVACRLAQVLKLMLQPISFVLLPLVSTLWEQGKTEQACSYLSHSLFWFLVFALPMAAGLVAIGPELLGLLGTEEFTVSRVLVALLVGGGLCLGIYQVYVYIIYLYEQTWIQLLASTGLALFNLGFNLLLVPRIGLLGAALTTFISYAGQMLFVILYSRSLMRLTGFVSPVMKAAFGSGCVLVVATLAPWRGAFGVISKTLLGVLVYSGILWLTRAVQIKDIRRILQRPEVRPWNGTTRSAKSRGGQDSEEGGVQSED